MDRPTQVSIVVALAVLLAVLLAVPAAGDWIKTRDGALVETRGPWKVKGALVVFTAKNGALSSIRLSEVDLDGSAVATVDAQRAATETPEEPSDPAERPPVLVLTNEDVPPASTPRRVGEEEGEVADAEGSGVAASPVSVISWRRNENSEVDGIELVGIVQNQGRHIVTDLRVQVRLFDEDGEFLGSSNAFLGALSLAPNVTTRMRAVFPEIDSSSLDPRFEIRSSTIQVEAVEPSQPEGSES